LQIYYRICPTKQLTVALSLIEAEFAAASDAGRAVLYLQSVFSQLGVILQKVTPLHIDNKGAEQMANLHRPTRRTKHLDIKYFALLN